MEPRFVVIDSEYRDAAPGQVEVVCMVAIDLSNGRVYRMWLEGSSLSSPPFPCGPGTILVAHAVAPAEARCWRTLNWPEPGGWIDTYVESRVIASGERPEGGFGLLACCLRSGIKSISADHKHVMRELVLRGGPYSAEERKSILDYCESDVRETHQLFGKLLKP